MPLATTSFSDIVTVSLFRAGILEVMNVKYGAVGAEAVRVLRATIK